MRISTEGSVISEARLPDDASIYNPLSPPLRFGDHVYLATNKGSNIGICRFSYPELEYDTEFVFGYTSSCMGQDPILTTDPDSSDLILFHRCEDFGNLIAEKVDADMNPTGATMLFGHVPVTSYHASASTSGWLAYGFQERISVTSLQFWEFNPTGELWLAPDLEAHLFNSSMDSDHADHAGFRTSGGVFALYYAGQWQVWARLNAERSLRQQPFPELQVHQGKGG
jgi:hypothetical protein